MAKGKCFQCHHVCYLYIFWIDFWSETLFGTKLSDYVGRSCLSWEFNFDWEWSMACDLTDMYICRFKQTAVISLVHNRLLLVFFEIWASRYYQIVTVCELRRWYAQCSSSPSCWGFIEYIFGELITLRCEWTTRIMIFLQIIKLHNSYIFEQQWVYRIYFLLRFDRFGEKNSFENGRFLQFCRFELFLN